MDTLALLRGLRFVDSFFPSGGYAYSSGLEAAVHAGAIRNVHDLDRSIQDLLRGGLGCCEAVAVGLAHEAALEGNLQDIVDVDRKLDAMKLSREVRLASRHMVRQVCRIAAEQADRPLLSGYLAAVQSARSPGHLAISLGLILGSIGWQKQDAIAVYLYQAAVGFISAALRLLPVGQREGQLVLDRWLPLIEALSRAAVTRRQMTSWTPVQDIYAMRHHRLATRLFRS